MSSPTWIRVGTLDEIGQKGIVVVQGEDRPIAVVAHDGKVDAVDNRCPHLGFPLHKGTVKDGILTCHWHQARFDLCSGCAFDLWADDVPAFDVRIEGEAVFVASLPRHRPDASYHRARLRRGMEQSIGLLQAKGLLGWLNTGAAPLDVVRDVAGYAAEHLDAPTGVTDLTIAGTLAPLLSSQTTSQAGSQTTFLLLFRGAREVARAAVGSRRQARQPLDGRQAMETLKRWFREFIKVRDREAAERVLRTAIAQSASTAELADMVFAAISDRVYSSQGHLFDFANKQFELLDLIGHEHAAAILPMQMKNITDGVGAEEQGAWHHPIELIEPLREFEAELPELLGTSTAGALNGGSAEGGQSRSGEDRPTREKRNGRGRPSYSQIPPVGAPAALATLALTLLGDDPLLILRSLRDALAAGTNPADLAREVAYAAAMRLARFAASNEVGDWFNPQHTFTYANAVHQAVLRSPTPDVVRAIAHAAMSVYLDRFLNVPPAKLPGEGRSLDDLPADPTALCEQILKSLDGRSNLDEVCRLAARYCRLGHAIEPLFDTLAYATVREDLDFHTLQVLEAGIRQYHAWPAGSPHREHIVIAIARNLAAVCPTRRANLKTATTALRLHRGDRIFDEEEP